MQKVDPAVVLPPHILDKVMSNLDPATLSRTMSVNKSWQNLATRNALKREDVPVHASPEEVTMINSDSFFVGRVVLLCLFRWTFLVDFVKTYREAAMARVLLSLRLTVPVLLLLFPATFVVMAGASPGIKFWALQVSELAILVLPGARKAPEAASIVLALLYFVLCPDVAVLNRFASSHVWFPFVSLACASLLFWSMFIQRIPSSLAHAADMSDPSLRLPLFFHHFAAPVRAIRGVIWIVAAAPFASIYSVAVAIVPLGVAAFVLHRHVGNSIAVALVQFLRVSVLSLLVTLIVFVATHWHLPNVMHWIVSTATISMMLWILTALNLPWFKGSLATYPRTFRLAALTSVVVAASSLLIIFA